MNFAISRFILNINYSAWLANYYRLLLSQWQPTKILREYSKYLRLFKASRSSHPGKGVLKKRCSGNMQQIYRRTPILKCDFNKVAFTTYCPRAASNKSMLCMISNIFKGEHKKFSKTSIA